VSIAIGRPMKLEDSQDLVEFALLLSVVSSS
jgi:hypothetical protein